MYPPFSNLSRDTRRLRGPGDSTFVSFFRIPRQDTLVSCRLLVVASGTCACLERHKHVRPHGHNTRGLRRGPTVERPLLRGGRCLNRTSISTHLGSAGCAGGSCWPPASWPERARSSRSSSSFRPGAPIPRRPNDR